MYSGYQYTWQYIGHVYCGLLDETFSIILFSGDRWFGFTLKICNPWPNLPFSYIIHNVYKLHRKSIWIKPSNILAIRCPPRYFALLEAISRDEVTRWLRDNFISPQTAAIASSRLDSVIRNGSRLRRSVSAQAVRNEGGGRSSARDSARARATSGRCKTARRTTRSPRRCTSTSWWRMAWHTSSAYSTYRGEARRTRQRMIARRVSSVVQSRSTWWRSVTV